MVDAVLVASVLDQSMIGTFGVSAHEPARPSVDLESTLAKEGIDATMTSSSTLPPPSPQQD